MEVFVLQIQGDNPYNPSNPYNLNNPYNPGSKHWTLYDPQTLSPRPDLIHKPSADSLSPPLATLTLRPGDILYIPSGQNSDPSLDDMIRSLFVTLSIVLFHLFLSLYIYMVYYLEYECYIFIIDWASYVIYVYVYVCMYIYMCI